MDFLQYAHRQILRVQNWLRLTCEIPTGPTKPPSGPHKDTLALVARRPCWQHILRCSHHIHVDLRSGILSHGSRASAMSRRHPTLGSLASTTGRKQQELGIGRLMSSKSLVTARRLNWIRQKKNVYLYVGWRRCKEGNQEIRSVNAKVKARVTLVCEVLPLESIKWKHRNIQENYTGIPNTELEQGQVN